VFGRCVRTHPPTKHAILPCYWMHHCVLFFMKWHISAYYGWFLDEYHFFFFFIFSLFQKKCTFVLFSLDLSISVFFLFFIVVLGLIIKVLVFFQFSHWIIIFYILFFPQFSPYSFDFWFSLAFLLKFCWFPILSFNQSLYFFIVFNLTLILLIYFPFC
jgi:hypothetical protein